jgi:TM2 domain-containing membrane protein YozV
MGDVTSDDLHRFYNEHTFEAIILIIVVVMLITTLCVDVVIGVYMLFDKYREYKLEKELADFTLRTSHLD